MKGRTKSPLKDKPLRNPGQSLEERKRDLVLDRLLHPLLIALIFSIFALMEIVRVTFDSPPQPWFWGAVALIAIAWAVYRVHQTQPQLKALSLAIDGEKAVGQYLEKLRTDGFEVFHDVCGSNFNLDHVIIGPAGIFTIETKSWRKPERGETKIAFDGETLTAAGRKPDRDPVIQARAQASWLSELLKESTGKKLPVKPVVLFPGWFIEQAAGTSRDVWVLNPKSLPEFLRHEQIRMVEDDVKLASFHLGRFVRSSESLPSQ